MRDALLASTAEITATTYGHFFQGIDASTFRPGVTAEQAMNLLIWAFNGLGRQYMTLLRHQPLDLESVRNIMTGEVDTYVVLLRHGIENGQAWRHSPYPVVAAKAGTHALRQD